MKHWGHATYKRTAIIANSDKIERFYRGKLNRSKTRCRIRTADVYFDRNQKKRYKGRTKELKSTQTLACTGFYSTCDCSVPSNFRTLKPKPSTLNPKPQIDLAQDLSREIRSRDCHYAARSPAGKPSDQHRGQANCSPSQLHLVTLTNIRVK